MNAAHKFVQFFKEHNCQRAEVFSEIRKSELKLENLINKYRFALVTLFVIGDLIIGHFAEVYDTRIFLFATPALLLVYLGIYRLHKLTKCEKPKPAIKYITIVLDYAFITMGIYELIHFLPTLTDITQQQTLLFGTMLIMVINSLSALRIQKHVIAISTIIGIFLNSHLHNMHGSTIIVTFYTGFLVFLTGFFNQYVSKYIFEFFATNFRLNEAMNNLSQANEEINTQNDELNTQNEYLAKQRDQIAHQKSQITSSIEYAQRIQEAMLDSEKKLQTVIENSFVLFKPKDIVSGDFYWYKIINHNNKDYAVFSAIDCTGHGVPGAFLSMLGYSFLNDITSNLTDEDFKVSNILNELRNKVKSTLHQNSNENLVKDGMDMSICAIDYNEMKLQYAGANNALYLIKKGENEIQEIKPDKMPIGVYIKEKDSFTNHEINVEKGDLVYLFSDGYIDQFGGEKGEKFKKRRFKELLLSIKDMEIGQQKKHLESELINWMGKYDQLDDITVIGVRV